MLLGRPSISPTKRLFGRTDFNGFIPAEKPELGPCWVYQGSSSSRYGTITYRSEGVEYRVMAHRLSYEYFMGPIGEGLQIDHLCRNTKCVNPTHLEPVTPRINSLRSRGPAAINSAKTHCKRGHPLNGDNLVTQVDGRRNCKACRTLYPSAKSKDTYMAAYRMNPENKAIAAARAKAWREANPDRYAAHLKKAKELRQMRKNTQSP